ncbi:enoyl-CoA hydratase/isomerase family protein, partial [Lysinibacillus sp. D4A1_S13]|uniref:enoyl-CoA hydratase/isomerase family protein n=1 Tax=Lysinibacillus sp. D4A1_S13 TaxID=2941228 RepID=UPI0020C0448A
MTENVLFSVSENGVASITLNRPKALNSLSYDMLQPIGQKLKEWENDEQIALIVLQGAGTKGFCAGGDIKT